MSNAQKSKFPTYVAVEGDGTKYPQLYCPVCGIQVTPDNEGCPHLLFECAFSTLDGEVGVNFLHPKFNKTTDAIEEELWGTRPTNLASKLNLDPASTLVLVVQNMFSSLACSDIVDVAVGIEFPPCGSELKAYKGRVPESKAAKAEEKSILPAIPKKSE